MHLINPIHQAAQGLGKHLCEEVCVQEFVRLQEKIKTNPEVSALEEQYSRLY
jgi:hypothetical protein